jgi:hypothetical protein
MSPMAVKITERALRGYLDYETNCKYQPELLTILKDETDRKVLIENLQTPEYWGIENMEPNKFKFKAVVGNPPYQEITIGHGAQATALYPRFIEVARKLMPKYVSLITPSRWLSKQGLGINPTWVDEVLSTSHFIKMEDYIDAGECFPGVEIKGGVSYFLYADTYNGDCNYTLHQSGNIQSSLLQLSNKFGIVIRDTNAAEIISKVLEKEGNKLQMQNFSTYVGPLHYFDNEKALGSNWKKYVKEPDSKHNIKCYVNKQMDPDGFGWMKESDVPRNRKAIPLHKVFMPKAGGSGRDTQIIGKPFYGEPNSVCSFTYICIGYDPIKHNLSKDECLVIISYLKTRFLRYLVSVSKKTQNTSRDVFQFVPLQNFTAQSDIDWSKSIPEIDQQLYAKYNLSEDEISFIEKMIKPME